MLKRKSSSALLRNASRKRQKLASFLSNCKEKERFLYLLDHFRAKGLLPLKNSSDLTWSDEKATTTEREETSMESTETIETVENDTFSEGALERESVDNTDSFFSSSDEKSKSLPAFFNESLYYGSPVTVGEAYWLFLNLFERHKLDKVSSFSFFLFFPSDFSKRKNTHSFPFRKR